ncbi:hypothetical protein T12_8632 [Trichinella patagoniensis]|uniref:Uncharacterized protein n=1 Tax=Trichinella patagoniensis TaxID=990121 RepID=A0A0V1AFG1_9BILA|nr:hypothetical protein T12_8632 [Trichinella patagoniensis]
MGYKIVEIAKRFFLNIVLIKPRRSNAAAPAVAMVPIFQADHPVQSIKEALDVGDRLFSCNEKLPESMTKKMFHAICLKTRRISNDGFNALSLLTESFIEKAFILNQ